MQTETVFKGAGNEIHLVLTEQDRAQKLEAISRMQLSIAERTLDSADTPEVFDWQTYPRVLVLRLGKVDLPAGLHSCRLKVFSLDYPHPLGLVWADGIKIEVIA